MAKSVLKKRGQKRKTSTEQSTDETPPNTVSDNEPNPKQSKLNETTESATTASQISDPGYSSQVIDPEEQAVIEVNNDSDEAKTETVDAAEQASTKSFQEDITIVFRDAEIAAHYKQYFYLFAKSYSEFHVCENADGLSLGISVDRATMDDGELIVIDDADNERHDKKKRKRKKKKDDMFMVDTNPFVKNKECESTKYCSKFSFVEGNEEGCEEEGKPEMACFNCGGGHSIRDCKEPKDFARIRAAKMKKRKSALV